jgi:hypothetical protein
VSMDPTAVLGILLGLPHQHLVEKTEDRASACRLSGTGMQLGRGHAQIHARLMEADPASQMGQDKMK